MKTAFLGIIGTLASVELSALSQLAACAAGFGTAAWMVCQITLSIRHELQRRRRK